MILEPTGTWQPAFNLNCGVEKPNDTIPHPDQLVKWGGAGAPVNAGRNGGGSPGRDVGRRRSRTFDGNRQPKCSRTLPGVPFDTSSCVQV